MPHVDRSCEGASKRECRENREEPAGTECARQENGRCKGLTSARELRRFLRSRADTLWGWRRGKAGGETRTGGRPASAPDAAGSIRSKHGCRAGVGTGRKQRSHQRDLAGDGGRCCLSIEICCCSVAQSCPTLCNLNCTMPGFPVLHYLLEFAQTHVH